MLKNTKYTILILLLLLSSCVHNHKNEVQSESNVTEIEALRGPQLSELMVPPNVLNSPNIMGEFTFAGEPVDSESRNLAELLNLAYIAALDEDRKCPAWVIFKLPGTIPSDVDINAYQRFSFKTDNRTQSKIKTTYYTNSGFDRGHMAPSFGIYKFFGEDEEKETYFMSNICPQTAELNRVRWKELEELMAGTHNGNNESGWAEEYGELWVITGPIYDNNVELLTSTTPDIPNIEIPDAFYKIVVGVDEANNEIYVLSFIMPNSTDQTLTRKPMKEYLVSVNDIEEATGLDFFTELSDDVEDELEGMVPTEIWPTGPSS